MALDYGTLTYTRVGQGAPQQWKFRLGSMTIGSGADNDVVLDEAQVTRFHARFVATAEGCWVTDLNSTTGTFLNQVRLQPNVRHPLRDSDNLRIGTWTLRYTRGGPPVGLPVQPPAGTAEPLRPVPQMVPPDVAAKLPQLVSPIQPGPVVRRLRGNGGPPRNRRQLPQAQAASSYLQYLPPSYQDDAFLGRFLLIFESILDPLERTIDGIHQYFDPRLAPEPLLPWLATWMDVVLNDKWPVERRRMLLTSAMELYRWRGTRRGLREYLRIYAGVEPLIEEPGGEARGAERLATHVFRVTLTVLEPELIDTELVEAIIETEKPAHTGYILEIRQATENTDAVAETAVDKD